MVEELAQVQRMEALGILSGGIAHDFNNILTSIIGNAEIVLMDIAENGKGRNEIQKILKSGNRARDLVQQIMNLSRPESGKSTPIFLSPIIKEALKLLRSTLPSNIRIVADIQKPANRVKADSIQVYQVFMNICANAKLAMEDQDTGVLTVRLREKDMTGAENNLPPGLDPAQKYIELSVSDNGNKMDQEAFKEVCDPDAAGNGAQDGDAGSGAGFGSAATCRIIRSVGGRLIINTRPDGGTACRVFWPVHEPSSGKARSAQMISEMECGRILFVDDEKDILSLADRMFKNFGYDITTTDSGKKALDLFLQSPRSFDLLITDMAMPEMTGESLAREIIGMRPEMPVILCTGFSEKIDRRRAGKIGIREFVDKPYRLRELIVLASKFIRPENSGRMPV